MVEVAKGVLSLKNRTQRGERDAPLDGKIRREEATRI